VSAEADTGVTVAPALTLPIVAYCVTVAEANRLIEEMVIDAKGGLIGIDIETTATAEQSKRLAALRLERARAEGARTGLRRVEAQAAEIAAQTAALKAIEGKLVYAEQAGLDPHRARIRLVQLYGGGQRVAVIDLFRLGEAGTQAILLRLQEMRLVAHNAAFELAFLTHHGIEPAEMHCTLQAVRLTLGEVVSLADAAATYLGIKLDKEKQTSNWAAERLTLDQIEYAARDAVVCRRLADKVLPLLGRQTSTYEIQMMAVPAVMRMEQRGFRFDVSAHAGLMEKLRHERAERAADYAAAALAAGLDRLVVVPRTPTAKADLLQALLTSDELRRWTRTEKSGALSTRRSELSRAAHYPPIAALVQLSSVDKLISAFGDNLAALVSPATGRVHAHYIVAKTASGRATCSGPNVQQVPRDKRFRALFVPEPGNVLVVADYSMMELRAASHISGDLAMMAAFEQGLDLHRMTAAAMTGKPPEEVTDGDRNAAKAINFGSLYGMGANGLVKRAWDNYGTVLTVADTERQLAAFTRTFPPFARWRRDHHDKVERRREIVIGRDAAKGLGRLYPMSRLPPNTSSYTRACNLPIQGACADASMLALAYIDQTLFEQNIDGGPVAWLHDEIVLEVAEKDAERAERLLEQAMTNAFAETFPGAPLRDLVKAHIGADWAAAKL
jgi:DNA polymerase-1